MTRDDVLNSIQLKKRFCKDCNLPIAVFDNPYFYERLSTLDILYDCVEKFDDFCNELLNYKTEQDYFEAYNSIKNRMITYIKDNSVYQEFDTQLFNKPDLGFGKRNPYVEQNDGGTFVSVDMKKANFSAMYKYSKLIFDSCNTWEEFVGKFTDSQHIKNSKYIRQVVLGACNPKQQIRFENFLMTYLCKHIIEKLGDSVDIYSLGEDEIIITIQNPNEPVNFHVGVSLNQLKDIVNSCPGEIGNLVRVEMFDLHKISDLGWMKVMCGSTDKIEFKCIDAEIFHQIVKHYFNLRITENDLVFYHNGRLARFLKEVDNPWNE